MSPAPAVAVEVPATSANLGPGFDALAVALDVRLRVRTTVREDRRVLAEGAGADELPDGDDNLVWRSLVAYCEWADVPVPDVSLRACSEIPLERGMGSSAAAAVAGVALGRVLAVQARGQEPGVNGGGHPRAGGGSDQDLIELASTLEGHADNAAAAVLGGVVVCNAGHALRLEPSEHLRPVLCIPESRQATSAARALLPEKVPHAHAAANGARAAVVLAGLTGGLGWRPEAMTDVLHEPARFALMPASGRLVGGLREEGLGACLSGAGPAVLAIVPASDDAAVQRIGRLAGDDWLVRPSAWDRAGAAWSWTPRPGPPQRVG